MDGRIKPGADDGKDDPVPKGSTEAGRRGGRGGGGDFAMRTAHGRDTYTKIK